jgi:hypothetical protein
MIKQYIKGFFWSFQLYLDKNIIKRKVSLKGSEINIISYVHRPAPKSRRVSKLQPFSYSNPKEKQLHEGLLSG